MAGLQQQDAAEEKRTLVVRFGGQCLVDPFACARIRHIRFSGTENGFRIIDHQTGIVRSQFQGFGEVRLCGFGLSGLQIAARQQNARFEIHGLFADDGFKLGQSLFNGLLGGLRSLVADGFRSAEQPIQTADRQGAAEQQNARQSALLGPKRFQGQRQQNNDQQ